MTAHLNTALTPTGLPRYAVDWVAAQWSFTEMALYGPDQEDYSQGYASNAELVLCTGQRLPFKYAFHGEYDETLVDVLCGLPCPTAERQLAAKLERYYTDGVLDRAKVRHVLEQLASESDEGEISDAQVDTKVGQVGERMEQLKALLARATEEKRARAAWEDSGAVISVPAKRVRDLERRVRELEKDAALWAKVKAMMPA